MKTSSAFVSDGCRRHHSGSLESESSERRALQAGRQAFASALWQLTGTFFLPATLSSGRVRCSCKHQHLCFHRNALTSSSPRRLCALPPTFCYPWERPFSTANGFSSLGEKKILQKASPCKRGPALLRTFHLRCVG